MGEEKIADKGDCHAETRMVIKAKGFPIFVGEGAGNRLEKMREKVCGRNVGY